VPSNLLEEDIRQLLARESPGEAALRGVVDAVLPCYERAAKKLRLKAIHEALTDHGRVVTDVKWRVDTVSHANTGEAINVPVTLWRRRSRGGGQGGQVGRPILPEELRKLQQACEQALR